MEEYVALLLRARLLAGVLYCALAGKHVGSGIASSGITGERLTWMMVLVASSRGDGEVG